MPGQHGRVHCQASIAMPAFLGQFCQGWHCQASILWPRYAQPALLGWASIARPALPDLHSQGQHCQASITRQKHGHASIARRAWLGRHGQASMARPAWPRLALLANTARPGLPGQDCHASNAGSTGVASVYMVIYGTRHIR